MNATDLLKQILLQGRQMESLSTRAHQAQNARRVSADRVFFSLQDSFTFQQGQNVVQSLLFNVPHSDDFFGTRLALYPFVRRIAVSALATGVTEDLTFRPTIWSFQYPMFTSVGSTPLARCAVDALLEMSVSGADQTTRRYQNAAFAVSQTFSGYTSPVGGTIASDVQQLDSSQSPSALVFDPEWELKRGSTVSLRVTPLFSGERSTAFTDGLINEYRIWGVLEGFKRVR
jgi:hypothetical protein